MEIRTNDPTQTDNPPFIVVDDNENIVFYAVTEQECQDYINNQN